MQIEFGSVFMLAAAFVCTCTTLPAVEPYGPSDAQITIVVMDRS